MKNYYRVLNVAESASDAEIRIAYFALAKECHPDLNPGSPEKRKRFDEITKAFRFLQSPLNRMGLDAELHAARKKAGAQKKEKAPEKEKPVPAAPSLAEINSMYANQINEYETLVKSLLKKASDGTVEITEETKKNILKQIRRNKAIRTKMNR